MSLLKTIACLLALEILVCGNAYACSELIKVPCNEDAYQACLKDICPPENDALCKNDEYRLYAQIKPICTCANLINAADKAKENLCYNVETPAAWKAWATETRIEEKKPHYCGGFLHSPCNEEKFKACAKDFEDTFCKNGGCEGVGPAMGASCACENLIDKKNMSKEEFCSPYMPPAELKAEMLKAIHKK